MNLSPESGGRERLSKRSDNAVTSRLLRLKPAARYLSISAGTLRAIVQRGELPIIKLAENGHSPWLLDRMDLDAWIEQTKIRLE
jgi:excisionase family DNA binding protein